MLSVSKGKLTIPVMSSYSSGYFVTTLSGENWLTHSPFSIQHVTTNISSQGSSLPGSRDHRSHFICPLYNFSSTQIPVYKCLESRYNRLIVSAKFDSKDDCVFWISEEPRQIFSSAFADHPFSHFLWHLCCSEVPEARGEAFDTTIKNIFSQI